MAVFCAEMKGFMGQYNGGNIGVLLCEPGSRRTTLRILVSLLALAGLIRGDQASQESEGHLKGLSLEQLGNIEVVQGTEDDARLPAGGIDVALLVDVYHEFDHPREMMEGIVRGLKPGGRVILIEYRAEDPNVMIKPHHKMSEDQAKKEMAAVGLVHVKTSEDLPQQHFMVFQKPAK